MKCICGDEFIFNKDILPDDDRCPNCNRNIFDIKSDRYTKKLETCLEDWLFSLETYGAGFIMTNCPHYKIEFEKALNDK